MSLGVVIVTYQSAETIERCLASIPAGTRVVVVDNASSDATSAIVATTKATLVRNRTNTGFARAANQGARLTDGEFVLFLNPDAELHPGCATTLTDALSDDAGRVIVGPAAITGSDEPVAGFWPFPNARHSWLYALGLHRLARGVARPDAGFVIGACMMVRREWFDALGGFDERFWLYGEDADLCWRARSRGGRSAVIENAAITHVGGHSSQQLEASFEHFHRGTELFIAQHAGSAALASHRLAVCIGAVGRAALFAFIDRPRSRWFSRLALRELVLLVRSPFRVSPLPHDEPTS